MGHKDLDRLIEERFDQITWIRDNKSPEEIDGEGFMDPDGRIYLSWYLGSVLNYSPSGKYYAPWTSNQTAQDVVDDGYFWEGLTERLDADLPGYWIEQGEGDPLDLFLLTVKEDEENDKVG